MSHRGHAALPTLPLQEPSGWGEPFLHFRVGGAEGRLAKVLWGGRGGLAGHCVSNGDTRVGKACLKKSCGLFSPTVTLHTFIHAELRARYKRGKSTL